MKKLVLDKAWTYRVPTTTIDYPKGEHEVTDAIYQAAVNDGAVTEGQASGSRSNDSGTAKDAGAATDKRAADRNT